MKTKIIYISGNEVFEMAQIRAAFEEVRNALGLDNDTVLFGVPVDQDNALINTVTEAQVTPKDIPVAIETDKIIEEEPAEETVEAAEPEITQIVETITDEVAEEKPVVEFAETAEPDTDTVIPILSILSSNDDDVAQETTSEHVNETENIEDITITAPIIPEDSSEIQTTDNLAVSIDDIVADEMPITTHKKTLEELLETMPSLGEDTFPEIDQYTESEENAEENADFSISMTDDTTDTDATLAQLASEFAQTQDKIPEAPKSSSNGKIGKLKNILPFKKAKRDDNGLMGDLFGWAGIAANDEDFSIPGFFTGAVGHK